MSPEQAAGRAKELTALSDVWSLGAVFYQMLSGQVPFSGKNHAEIFRRILEEEPVSLGKGQKGLKGLEGQRGPEDEAVPLVLSAPEDLSTLATRCLQKDATRRLPSALFLAEELERWLAGKAIFSRRISLWERAGRWVQRHPWPVAAGLAASVAVCALVFAMTRHSATVGDMSLLPTVPPVVAPASRVATGDDRPMKVNMLTAAADGWLYGGSIRGGKFDEGTLFRLKPSQPDQTEVLAHWSGNERKPGGELGQHALAPLAAGPGGVLYGCTTNGGARNVGTIFRVKADGAFETLYEFLKDELGRAPVQVRLHSDGWLWGGTIGGGGAGKGGVFKFHPNTREFVWVFSLGGPDDPVSVGRRVREVVEVRPGLRVFWGGTEPGAGTAVRSVLFALEDSNKPRIIYAWPDDAPKQAGGTLSNFAVGADESLYFTTYEGGENNMGTLQRMRLDGSPPVVLHHFSGPDGAAPASQAPSILVDGSICGMTCGGGAYGQGVVFAFMPGRQGTGGEVRVLGSLHHSAGRQVMLAAAADGLLYAASTNDEDSWIFRCDAKLQNALTQISYYPRHTPKPNPGPQAGPGRLAVGRDGWMYGACYDGGKFGHGTIFRWKEDLPAETMLNFTDAGGAAPASHPVGAVTFGSDGALYGFTEYGGPDAAGIVYRYHEASEKFTVLAVQSGIRRADVSAGMVTGPDGALYGTVPGGGSNGCGLVIRIKPAREGQSTSYEILAEFTGIGGLLPGIAPGPLTVGPDGACYGVTCKGGRTNCGTAFRVSGTEVSTLGPLPLDGDCPAAHCLLAPGKEGWLYGLTQAGRNCVMFRLHPPTKQVELIRGPGGMGWNLWGWGGLVPDGADSFLYVSANLGGNGGVLRVWPDGKFKEAGKFDNSVPGIGKSPECELLPMPNGAFYGTYPKGGPMDRGGIYKIHDGHLLAWPAF